MLLPGLYSNSSILANYFELGMYNFINIPSLPNGTCPYILTIHTYMYKLFNYIYSLRINFGIGIRYKHSTN